MKKVKRAKSVMAWAVIHSDGEIALALHGNLEIKHLKNKPVLWPLYLKKQGWRIAKVRITEV